MEEKNKIVIEKGNMFHSKVEMLIPFVSEEFITYPLWEEGKYIPFLNFWQVAKTFEERMGLNLRIKKLSKIKGYSVEELPDFMSSLTRSSVYNFRIYPTYRELKNGSYNFVKKDWSLEEMVDLVVDFVNKRND